MKPILFNTNMVRALLEGRKTVTRRAIKWNVANVYKMACCYGKWNESYWKHIPVYLVEWYAKEIAKPPCQPGDILYVRETFSFLPCSECEKGCLTLGLQDAGCYIYKADKKQAPYEKWMPSIHMPKEAARIFLRVTGVRVERLQSSFTEPICPILELQAEGIDIGETCQECIEHYGEPCCIDTVDEDGTDEPECGVLDEVRDDFSRLWDSTIKPADRDKYGWAANPWVWVIEFERISREGAIENGMRPLHTAAYVGL